MPIVDTDGTVKLFPGIKEKDVKALLKPFESRKIVHFKSMPGGSASFGGFDLEETWKVFQEDMMRIPAMWCCIDAHEAQQRGQPFPPGQTWYDLLHDIIPHQDKFGRTWTDKWSIKLGADTRTLLRHRSVSAPGESCERERRGELLTTACAVR